MQKVCEMNKINYLKELCTDSDKYKDRTKT